MNQKEPFNSEPLGLARRFNKKESVANKRCWPVIWIVVTEKDIR